MDEATGEMSVSEFRAHLAEVLNETAYSGSRTYITRAGKRVAAIVPFDEAEMLEAAEDEYLNRLADEAKQSSTPHRPFAELVAELAVEDGGEVA
ncbi:type II toxin-antitoxin system Phd/YefM family antitoxin [Glycomyces xiaoerkulensis]|uniref:type II toxin-antitoxin system Phd/YefM family antitoxin n=1 Tax=Glycomyces xiaoerkulensis TaxID=2038139 RepID=UPI0012FFEA0B|nr:type II toxin-antitoxin system Phd/YefM family antitoxin [Glycomyces xiaoerkulensis]